MFPQGRLRIPEADFALSGTPKHQTAPEHHDESPVNHSPGSFSIVSTRNEKLKEGTARWHLALLATKGRPFRGRSGQ